jgi:hypothetical protein
MPDTPHSLDHGIDLVLVVGVARVEEIDFLNRSFRRLTVTRSRFGIPHRNLNAPSPLVATCRAVTSYNNGGRGGYRPFGFT